MTRPTGRLLRAVAAVAAGMVLLSGCSDGGGPSATPDESATPGASADGGQRASLRLGLAPVDGFFVEGFELALTVTPADGHRRSYAWGPLVRTGRLQWPEDTTPGELRRWYTGVLVEPVPPGRLTVTSRLDVGMEAPEEACMETFTVPPGGALRVDIRMTDPRRGCPVAMGGSSRPGPADDPATSPGPQ